MRSPRTALFAIIVSTMVGPGLGNAATISATAMGTIFGDTQSDSQGPATTGDLFSAVCYNPHPPANNAEDCAHVRCAVNVEGEMAFLLSAQAQVASKGGAFEPRGHSASELVVDVSGNATWSETVTNHTGNPQTYFFDFTITPVSFFIFDDEGLSETDSLPHTTCFSAEVTLNGSQVIFTTSYTLTGGTVSHSLIGTGTPIPNTAFLDVGLVQYDFDQYMDSLSLGTLMDGESLDVEYTISVSGSTAFFFNGVAVKIGDPLDLCGDPGAFAGITASDPLPVTQQTWSATKSLFR